MTERSRRIAIWVAVFAALALLTWARIRLIDGLRDQGWFVKYYELADRVLAGDIPRDRIGDVSPGYLWLTVALRALGLGVHALRNLQIAGLTLAALLCALAAKRLGGWVAFAAALMLVLGNRAALVMASELEPEILILLLNAGALYALSNSPRMVNSALAGFLIGLSTITRPTAALILVLAAAWTFLRDRRATIPLVAAGAAPIIVILIVNASLTGHVFIMQPGSQLYEANNPLATGCAGVFPRIVADIQSAAHEPDYLHVAYRLIEGRANNHPIDAKASNRYWSRKAFAFMREYPMAALELFTWKGLLTVHHYDIYDLVTTKRKSMELARWPAIPFGVVFVLAVVAFVLRRERRDLFPAALFALATMTALVAFNVSSRQRNALLAPLAILAGAGVAEIISLARARSERALLAFGGVMIAIPLLGIEGNPMREDSYNWWTWLRASEARTEAYKAREQGDRMRAIQFASAASILDIEAEPLVGDQTLARTALAAAGQMQSPQRLFDVAVALEKANAWREAEAILATITGYRPRRENRAVSSVAYYRARAALRLGVPPVAFRKLIDEAIDEAPGDPHVLALRSITVDPDARRVLDSMHDPFTRDLALAVAYADLGDRARADALLTGLIARIPEWQRPAVQRHALRTANARSGSSGAGR